MKIASVIMAIGLFIILCILVIIKIIIGPDEFEYFYKRMCDEENKNVNMHSRRRLSSLDDE